MKRSAVEITCEKACGPLFKRDTRRGVGSYSTFDVSAETLGPEFGPDFCSEKELKKNSPFLFVY